MPAMQTRDSRYRRQREEKLLRSGGDSWGVSRPVAQQVEQNTQGTPCTSRRTGALATTQAGGWNFLSGAPSSGTSPRRGRGRDEQHNQLAQAMEGCPGRRRRGARWLIGSVLAGRHLTAADLYLQGALLGHRTRGATLADPPVLDCRTRDAAKPAGARRKTASAWAARRRPCSAAPGSSVQPPRRRRPQALQHSIHYAG